MHPSLAVAGTCSTHTAVVPYSMLVRWQRDATWLTQPAVKFQQFSDFSDLIQHVMNQFPPNHV